MMQRLKKVAQLMTISLSLAFFSVFSTGPALVMVSADATSQSAACQGLAQLNSAESCGTSGQSTVASLVSTVVTILSYIVGLAAVIAIILSGFNYVTSGGDSSKISAAKTQLIYALVGVLIVAFAQLLVHFALNQGSSAVNGTCPSNPALASDCKTKL